MGQGAIGLSFTAVCARAGARQVIAVDLFDYRLEYSKRFGATHTINPTKENLDEVVADITGGEMPDISVEAAGYPDTLNNALRLVKQFGKVIVFGMQENAAEGAKIPLETRWLMQNTPTVIPTTGARSGDPISHIENMIALKDRGWWDPAEMITHNLKFDDVGVAYDMYENRKDNIVKVVLSI